MRDYFIFLMRDGIDKPWELVFGDFNKDEVDDEMDFHEGYSGQMQIILTVDNQAVIDNVIKALNEGVK